MDGLTCVNTFLSSIKWKLTAHMHTHSANSSTRVQAAREMVHESRQAMNESNQALHELGFQWIQILWHKHAQRQKAG